MPDQLPVLKRRSWRHHSIDPLGVEQTLIHIWALVVPLSCHIQMIRSLERDRTFRTDFLVVDRDSKTDLSCHTRATDNGSLHSNLLDESCNEAHIAEFGVGVVARPESLIWERTAVSREVDGGHAEFLDGIGVVHDPVVLATVAASGVQEEDLLGAFARLLVEDLAFLPEGTGHVARGEMSVGKRKSIVGGSGKVRVATDNDILVVLGLFVRRSGTHERIVEELEDATPDVSPVGKGAFCSTVSWEAFSQRIYTYGCP